jgi:hypothetical protein
MKPTTDLKPAIIATCVWLTVGAALDAGLVHERRRPITHVLRTPPGVAFLAVLCLHVADLLGPVDPFRVAARLIPKRHSIHNLEGG